MLHGQVQVAGQLGQPGIGIDQPGRELVGVTCSEADALDAGNVGHVLQQQGKVSDLRRAAHLAQISVHVLAQQGDFLDALVGQTRHFDQHIIQGAAHLLAAGVGHHTVAAILAASFHDGDEGAGALNPGWWKVVELLDLGEADIHLGLVQARALVQHLWQAVQGLRAEHHVHIGCALDDFCAFLAGHATAHTNLHATGLQVFDATQVAENLLLRLLTHRAGVKENEVGFVHILRRLVALVHLAAECLDEYFGGHGGLALQSGKSMRTASRGARWCRRPEAAAPRITS